MVSTLNGRTVWWVCRIVNIVGTNTLLLLAYIMFSLPLPEFQLLSIYAPRLFSIKTNGLSASWILQYTIIFVTKKIIQQSCDIAVCVGERQFASVCTISNSIFSTFYSGTIVHWQPKAPVRKAVAVWYSCISACVSGAHEQIRDYNMSTVISNWQRENLLIIIIYIYNNNTVCLSSVSRQLEVRLSAVSCPHHLCRFRTIRERPTTKTEGVELRCRVVSTRQVDGGENSALWRAGPADGESH